jgi:hypothetical protein
MFTHPWQREARALIDDTRIATAPNQLLLAYQFEQARQSHPEGFTMDMDGQLYQGDGYAVGVTPDSFENVADALDTLSRFQITMGFRNLYLGYWRDEQDGREYIDVVMVSHSCETAMRLGAMMEQVAVWDFGNERAIRLDDWRMREGMARA